VKLKFNGAVSDLRDVIQYLECPGNWSEQPNGVWKFRRLDGAGLLWSSTQGTLWFDGPKAAALSFEREVRGELDAYRGAKPETDREVFVAHGGDPAARAELEAILNELELASYAARTLGGGHPLLEVLEGMSGKRGDAAFGIALLTAEDIDDCDAKPKSCVRPRACQEAIVETGMLLSALGRGNCIVLHAEGLNLPAQLNDVPRIPFRRSIHEVELELRTKLRRAMAREGL
jgi:predicted nucleotide-binding protein